GLLPSLALPPAFIFLANREGAGKTLLAKVCTIAVLGYAPTAAWASLLVRDLQRANLRTHLTQPVA
ncbi:MAG: hypothetical protein KJ072_14520, partial [Verrucomicrobia bacterium]|nr:hypothetical protein [Verrucomicrobiota bacterium]